MARFWYLLIKDLYLIHLNSHKNALNRSMFLIKCEPLMRDGVICNKLKRQYSYVSHVHHRTKIQRFHLIIN
jgi:hypothetical protein